MTEIPSGISAYHWNYYHFGVKAYGEGQDKEESAKIKDPVTRSWWLAGWHDSDIESSYNKEAKKC